MGLRFPGEWRFNPPADGQYLYASIPDAAVREFVDVVDRISSQGNRWEIIEHFKGHFGVSGRSSSEDWAESDLDRAMRYEARTAPLFIEAFFNGCDSLRNRPEGWYAPDPSLLNAILARHNVGYEIRPPDLLARDLTTASIPVGAPSPTLADQANSLIEASLTRSDELLIAGRGREAVQEVLWLLETVATAFRGVETDSGRVEGKYFNQIVRDLRAKRAGSTLDRILDWATSMHGYLSSPTGGGVRHGTDLSSGVTLDINQARLFCNLTRSYILFLLAEHQSLRP